MNMNRNKNEKQNKKFTVTIEFRAMGTDVAIDIVTEDPDDAKKLSATVQSMFEEYEEIFSRFRASSELSRLNARCGERVKVSTLLFSAIELACTYYDQTHGYFDPRIITTLENIGYDHDFHSGGVGSQKTSAPIKIKGSLHDDIVLDAKTHIVMVQKRIDLSGIAKSITLKATAQFLKDAGVHDFIVDAGGDMIIDGVSGTGQKWKIGLEGIANEKLLLALQDVSLATSGITRRQWYVGEKKFHHLINPKIDGEFSFDILSITVVDEDIITADVWAKTLFLMGDEGKKYAQENNIAALFLESNKKIYATKKIKETTI